MLLNKYANVHTEPILYVYIIYVCLQYLYVWCGVIWENGMCVYGICNMYKGHV